MSDDTSRVPAWLATLCAAILFAVLTFAAQS